MSEGFRRNFDAEIVDAAKGIRPIGNRPIETGRTNPSPPAGSIRTIVVHKQPKLLSNLLQFSCSIKPVGDDWHIEARTFAEQQRIVDLFRLYRVHGVLRRRKPAAGYFAEAGTGANTS